MNIGVNTRFLLPGRHLEGIGRYTFEVMKRMVQAHPEHRFYFFFDRTPDPSYLLAENVTPVVISPPARHPFLFLIWYEPGLSSALKKYKIDVFLSFDGFLSLLTTIPTVLVIHDLAYLHYPQHIPWIYRTYYRCFMPAFIRKAHTIVAVSEFTRKDILDKFSMHQDKVITATNALPSAYVLADKKGESPVNQPYFILPGSINPRKNTFAILKAFRRYNEEAAPEAKRRLVVAGRFMWGKDAVMEALWRELTDSGQLIHHAGAGDQEMIQLISHAEAVLYVSLFEGFGIPLLEAMACGVPLITSSVSSMPEVAGDAAILVDPHNEDQLVRAMKDVVTKPELRERLIKLGKERIRAFNWDKTSTTIFKALEKAALAN